MGHQSLNDPTAASSGVADPASKNLIGRIYKYQTFSIASGDSISAIPKLYVNMAASKRAIKKKKASKKAGAEQTKRRTRAERRQEESDLDEEVAASMPLDPQSTNLRQDEPSSELKRKKEGHGATKEKDKTTNESQEGSDSDEEMPDLLDFDSDFANLSEDEPPSKREKRYRRPKLSAWIQPVIQEFVQSRGDEIKKELQNETPDFAKIESFLNVLNSNIVKANKTHHAPVEDNNIRAKAYRREYEAWLAQIATDKIKGQPDEEWKAYYRLHKMFRLLNDENNLPKEWNIPSATAERMFGEKPSGVEELPDDADSAASYSDESESEESDLELDGIDGLEARMRKEYSSLSRGKVLYWWRVGTGTQIFVQYGRKARPIYRVRAGSSIPYDTRTTEQVLSITRGNAKVRIQSSGNTEEIWKYSRDDVEDIIGVGWKVEDDDDASTNALALIRPAKDIIYPHTRVLVKWKRGGISLERRGFIRRIANGSSLSGDRMIYLKAKELENTYWGYDVENAETEDELSGSDGSSSEQSSGRRTRPWKRSIKKQSLKSDNSAESDADTETSSDDEPAPRRSRRLARAKKTKSTNAGRDIEAEIDRLLKDVKRLRIKQAGGLKEKASVRKNHRGK
jgi:hypothetical protein